MILRNIREWNELWLFDDISVLVTNSFSLNLDSAIWIDGFALHVILNSVGFCEVEEIAWTVAWHGVEIVWAILKLVFTSLIERRISDVEVALPVGVRIALEV